MPGSGAGAPDGLLLSDHFSGLSHLYRPSLPGQCPGLGSEPEHEGQTVSRQAWQGGVEQRYSPGQERGSGQAPKLQPQFARVVSATVRVLKN